MDKSTIVIWVNIAYGVVYIITFYVRHFQFADKVLASGDEIEAGARKEIPLEYWGVSIAGLILYFGLTFTIIRKHSVFNTHFPDSFIIQFAVQFIVLLSFILADYKVFRYTASILVMTFPVFMFLNGLFKINPQYSNFESTIVEARKLADDVWEFNTELTERISRVNSDMTVALDQIVERQKQIERISALLESKQQEYEKLSSVVELDTKRAEEIFEALNYHPTTVWDTLISGFIGGIISLALTIIYTFFARRMGWRTL
jgi:hypothetical protein